MPAASSSSASAITLLDLFTLDASSPALRTIERSCAVVVVTALTVVAAQISVPLPFTPVPFTMQPLMVLVGAAALGGRRGAASQLLYLSLGVFGLPVFAASATLPPGVARLMGPTGGYLISYPLAALLTGWLSERGFDRRYLTSVVAMAAGLAVVFACGVLQLGVVARPALGIGGALAAGFFPFVLVDLFKIVAAGAVLPSVWRLTARRLR
jgi:biotin transport system substrate-specific component